MKVAQKFYQNPSIGILGPGAIGCALASRIQPIVPKLGMIGRQGSVDFQFTLKSNSDVHKFDLPALENFELLFVCVKAYQVPGLFAAHRSLFEKPDLEAVIFLCNGIVDEVVSSDFPSHIPVRMGLTTLAVKPMAATHSYELMNATEAVVQWGAKHAASQLERDILQLTSHAGLQWCDDIDFRRHRKWLYNSALNPVCALHGLDRNDMAGKFQGEVEELFMEAYELGERLWGAWPESADDLLRSFWLLIQQTGANRNSMVVDLSGGRSTEIDFLTGLYRLDPLRNYPQLSAITTRIHEIQNA
ncbi:MAG: ketopantoate reductase family protein [Oligoflexus sp.]